MIPRSKAIRLCIVSALAAALVAVGLGGYALTQFTPVGKVISIIRLLDQTYYQDFDHAEILEGAARGVVAALGDPYTVYMTQEEWYEFYIRTSGEYSGIGVTITEKDGGVCIVSPMKGTPAEAAGLQVNDFILKVDGKPVSSGDEAAALIRGPAGTEVVLTIYRDGDTFDVTIVREDITIPAVDYSMMDDGIGYIELITFNERSALAMTEAMLALDSQGAKAIILDLRYNGGGLLDRCIDIARLFVPEGTVVTIKGKSFEETTYVSQGPGIDKPLFVLVNGGTASASEILAGAIQDYQVGTLIGTTTFGKGLVQSLYPLRDGSALTVTEQGYLTSGGKDINGVGIEPDIVVEVTPEEEEAIYLGEAEFDPQLEKALEVLRSQL